MNIENVKPYHEAPEKPVYNLERPERNENSEDFETEMGTEKTHYVHFEENPETVNLDQAYKTRFSKGGRDRQLVKILDSQNSQGGSPEAKLEE